MNELEKLVNLLTEINNSVISFQKEIVDKLNNTEKQEFDKMVKELENAVDLKKILKDFLNKDAFNNK